MANNSFKIINAVSMGATYTSSSVQLLNYDNFSVQFSFTDAPVGTLKIQSSNDDSTWDDVADASYAVSAAGSVMFNMVEQEYSYFRAVYTRTSGTGTLNAYCTLKE